MHFLSFCSIGRIKPISILYCEIVAAGSISVVPHCDGAEAIFVIILRSVHTLQLDLNVSQRKIIEAFDAIETK